MVSTFDAVRAHLFRATVQSSLIEPGTHRLEYGS